MCAPRARMGHNKNCGVGSSCMCARAYAPRAHARCACSIGWLGDIFWREKHGVITPWFCFVSELLVVAAAYISAPKEEATTLVCVCIGASSSSSSLRACQMRFYVIFQVYLHLKQENQKNLRSLHASKIIETAPVCMVRIFRPCVWLTTKVF